LGRPLWQGKLQRFFFYRGIAGNDRLVRALRFPTLLTVPHHNRWLFRFAVLTAVATLGLVGVGGLVTSHGVGMSVPDWPTSYGYNMFALPVSLWLTGGVFHEHTHRLWASEVGILTLVLTCWLFGKQSRPLVRGLGVLLLVIGAMGVNRPNGLQSSIHIGAHGVVLLAASFFWPRCEAASRFLRWLGGIAMVTVLLQGLLGGLRLVLVCAIALLTSRWWQNRATAERTLAAASDPALGRWFLGITLLISLQLLIGATMRHQHAGLAIPDFPLAYGSLWPDTSSEAVARYNVQRVEVTTASDITAFQINLQMLHRLMALAILAGVGMLAWRMRREASSPLRRLAFFWLGLIGAQAALGAWTVWSNKAADVATLHVLGGALSLVTGAFGCIISLRRFTGAPAAQGASRAEAPYAQSAPAAINL
jgi:cytochrome c oxidase assembly protein subunit 15